MADELDEPAVLGLAWYDGEAVVAAFQQSFAGTQVEPGPRLVAAMTFEAAIHQHLPDFLAEQLSAARHLLGVVRWERLLSAEYRGSAADYYAKGQADQQPGVVEIRTPMLTIHHEHHG